MAAPPVNWFSALRTGYGALLVLAPDPVIRLYTGHRPDRPTRAVTRVLGARQVVQGLLCAGAPGPVVLVLGVEADVAHAASMVGLAALDRSHRRGGLVDALCAGSFAVAGLVLACRRLPRSGTPAVDASAAAQLAALREAAALVLARWALPAPLRRWMSRRDGRDGIAIFEEPIRPSP
ncbi:MAG: hypothetical protein DLM61_23300 [Pseudonocardiales bacterium]|nr:MAG: hypothetical protein DLM61_23300 [Pseudonocardiales bacterium]